jgi:hypothetical protein
MDSRSRTLTPIIGGKARKESRRYYSDSVGKRGALLHYRGSKRSDVPGLSSCFGLAAICAHETAGVDVRTLQIAALEGSFGEQTFD